MNWAVQITCYVDIRRLNDENASKNVGTEQVRWNQSMAQKETSIARIKIKVWSQPPHHMLDNSVWQLPAANGIQ